MTRPLILLDRDGVINEDISPNGVIAWSQFQFIPHAKEAIATLHQAGYAIAIVTNQSAIGKGLMTETTLHDIHHHMMTAIREAGGDIDAIYSCYDHPDHPTHRRKPNAGMLEEALRQFNTQAEKTPMIGDALRDLQAAYTAHCPRILLRTGKGATLIEENDIKNLQPVTICANLMEAALHIINHYPPHNHA